MIFYRVKCAVNDKRKCRIKNRSHGCHNCGAQQVVTHKIGNQCARGKADNGEKKRIENNGLRAEGIKHNARQQTEENSCKFTLKHRNTYCQRNEENCLYSEGRGEKAARILKNKSKNGKRNKDSTPLNRFFTAEFADVIHNYSRSPSLNFIESLIGINGNNSLSVKAFDDKNL